MYDDPTEGSFEDPIPPGTSERSRPGSAFTTPSGSWRAELLRQLGRTVLLAAAEHEDLLMSWTCPTCARTFARDEQFHSHDTEDVDAHFARRPERLRETFDNLISSLPSDVQVEALRSVIVLSAHRTFAYVTVQAKRLLVGVFLEHPIDSPRVLKIDRVSVRKFGSVIDVHGPGDVDDELQLWLRQAYQLCRQAVRTFRDS